MANIPSLKHELVFEPEVVCEMSTALDDVCHALGVSENSAQERETIAVRVIELARRGARNADRLRDRLLREAGVVPREPRAAGQQSRVGSVRLRPVSLPPSISTTFANSLA